MNAGIQKRLEELNQERLNFIEANPNVTLSLESKMPYGIWKKTNTTIKEIIDGDFDYIYHVIKYKKCKLDNEAFSYFKKVRDKKLSEGYLPREMNSRLV